MSSYKYGVVIVGKLTCTCVLSGSKACGLVLLSRSLVLSKLCTYHAEAFENIAGIDDFSVATHLFNW